MSREGGGDCGGEGERVIEGGVRSQMNKVEQVSSDVWVGGVGPQL